MICWVFGICSKLITQKLFKKKVQAGGPQCITEVSIELATTYQNAVVENFDRHLIKYIKYRLHNLFLVSDNKKLMNINFKKEIYH